MGLAVAMSDPTPAGKPRIRVRRPPRKRKVSQIGADEAEREPTGAAVWELVRARYSKPARLVGDAAARTMSLADLLALETAAHGELADAAARVDPAGQERVALAVAKVQSRKVLRALTVILAPSRRGRDEDRGHALPPDMIEGTPEWTRLWARHELHPDDEILD